MSLRKTRAITRPVFLPAPAAIGRITFHLNKSYSGETNGSTSGMLTYLHALVATRNSRPTDDIDELETERPQASVRQGTRFHPLVWLGLFLTLFLLGWMGLNVVTAWWQGVQNDWTYGKERHFEINAVVGHRDSPTNPSHFTAEYNNGAIIVIELPGGNVTQAKIYQIETIPNNVNNPPVKLSFQDMNADGKPDMLVVIGDGSATLYVTLYNNGTEFVSKL